MYALLLALSLASGPPTGVVLQGGTPASPKVTLAWDPALPTDTVTGYRVLWGTDSANPNNQQEILGKVSQAIVTLSSSGTYFFEVEAENGMAVSGPSNEVTTTINIPTECTLPLGAQAVSIFITQFLASTPNVGTRASTYFQLASQTDVTDIHVELGGQVWSKRLTGTDSGAIWFTAPLTPGTYPFAIVASNQYGCTSTTSRDAAGKLLTVTVVLPPPIK